MNAVDPISARGATLLQEQIDLNYKLTDRRFAWLMFIQWLAGLVAALWISPRAWEGRFSHTHIHVWIALFLGGAISAFPIFMAVARPGSVVTRHVIAVGQMLSCGLLIHLTGGRIESHFQYFGALAFLAFYRDWRVLVTASFVAAMDHFIRGVFWPQSIFGVVAASWWRWIEHVGWVLFEDVFLVLGIRQSLREMHGVAERQAKLEIVNETVERTVAERTEELRTEIAEHIRTGDQLRLKTALLEAQLNSSPDGILVVDEGETKILQNQRLIDLIKIPGEIAADPRGEKQLHWVVGMVKHPPQFIERVNYVRSHPDEISRDEIEFKDGTVLDRYSAPVMGTDGRRHGRIWTFRDITERKRADEARDRMIAILESTTDMVGIADPEGHIIYLNRAGCNLFDVQDGDVTKSVIRDFLPNADTHPVLTEGIPTAIREGVWSGETVLLSRTGRQIPVSQVILAHKSNEGKLEFLSTIVRDMTERKKLEGKLIQSQKMETVGKLAGGIAHEFNSILTAIIGQTEYLQSELPGESPLGKSAKEIMEAATRAATLTRQLLAYGRKQFLQPEILDVNRVITGMESVFRLLMGGEVSIQIVPAPRLAMVMADAGQIEQVIMNMVMNARDAMPKGGKLTLETANVSNAEESVGRYPELKAGEYVMLAITDTGVGMTEQVKARLFEPFFTTKGVGQGTGLGLSTCYGIVKQSGGHIAAYSELGRGTTFRIYLPQTEQKVKATADRAASPVLPRGTETILLVEDDPALREMAGALLRRQGYTVWTAANGIEALNQKQKEGVGHIDLLLTDLVMPHMGGKELADRVEALYPHTKILFTSAYTENTIIQQGVLTKGVELLQKPFTPSALARKVREVLEKVKPPESGTV
jgi:PAS domain S-box-containing protein